MTGTTSATSPAPGRPRTWYAAAVAPRVATARLLPTGGAGLVAGLALVNLVLGLLPVLFVVATSRVVGQVPVAVGGGVGSAAWDVLVRDFVLAAAAFCGQQVLAPAQTALGVRLKRRVDGRLRDRMLASTLRSTGIAPMEDQATLDALSEATRQVDSEFHTPGDACAGLLALVARYVRLAGFAVLVGLVSTWWAGVALVVATMVFRYGQRGGLRKYSTAWRGVVGVRRRAEYLRDVAMGAGAAKELRVFGLAGWFADRYEDATREMLAPVTARRRLIYLKPYLLYTAVGLAIGSGVLVVLARGAAAGDLTLTGLTLGLQSVVAALLLGEYYPESDVPTQYGMQSMAALEEFEERIGAAQDAGRTAGTGPVPPASPTVSLRFEGVAFRYPGASRTVLDGLDLELPAGLSTAVVGINGAGKTTLVKLLTRLHEPTAGRITSDGTDLADLDVAAWRRQVSVIFQDFVRYELSAADNIALGATHVPRDDAAVRDAARDADVLDVLEALPLGLDTPLSRAYEDGADLSGGQWQRVAIARSLYALRAGARVLVLDEPTSALDVRAEAAFFDRFVELTRGVTSVLVSHRFSSVRRADRIVVVDAGRVVEQGTHAELLALDGHYARLFRLQAERFEAGLDGDEHDHGRADDPVGDAVTTGERS
ncbi:ABC transporter ATP-binding protein [Cellulomonas cellasea]|uniref:ATP-binding cassette subfamily B protein n=1 Tax=Cellulomonas cellasea TaxID=43670 RepID=A0A7W4UH35_9CELL|nr:ABC transporter ATP-binding protein [Cellulomonas cellasea]MBB2923704.1 ATP-binding cassette subfamily B protein [Cellulomonas cellasea]